MIHQRHRWTDGQMTCNRKTVLCTIVHRAVKKEGEHPTNTHVRSRTPFTFTCTTALNGTASTSLPAVTDLKEQEATKD